MGMGVGVGNMGKGNMGMRAGWGLGCIGHEEGDMGKVNAGRQWEHGVGGGGVYGDKGGKCGT
jgi:hypothetical protein